MTTHDNSPETREEARARLLWNDLPGTGTGGESFRDHLWEGLREDERAALVDYTTAVWEAAQLDLSQKATPVTVEHTGRGAWGSALTILSQDPEALPDHPRGTILAVLL